MSNDHEIRPISWWVGKKGSRTYDELSFTVSIVDDCGGEYVEIEGSGESKIGVMQSEWPLLKQAIDTAIKACREYKETTND